MDFTRFFNSRDMREHIQKVGYSFNSLEATWLVWQCRSATVEEKHVAYRYIIDNMPDCEINRRSTKFGSLHQYLRDYIDAENEILECFKKTEPGTCYLYGIRELSEGETNYFDWTGGPFSTLDNCLKEIYDDPDEFAVLYFVRKHWLDLDKQSGTIEVAYSREGKVMDITCGSVVPELGEKYMYLAELFDCVWFKFPTPFKEGDLVCTSPEVNLNPDSKPVVLVYSQAMSEDEKVLAKCRKSGDISDMFAVCYFLIEDTMRIMDDYWYCCLYDLEFYRGEISGKNRIMKTLSSMLKKEIDEMIYTDAYMAVVLESMADSMKYVYDGRYQKDIMEKAGLISPNMEKGEIK